MWRFPRKVEAMKGTAMKTIYKTIEVIRDYSVFAAVLVPTVLMVLAALDTSVRLCLPVVPAC
jgi:hypothetical protein